MRWYFPVLRYFYSCLFTILSMSGSHRLPFTGRNTRTLSYFYSWYFLYLWQTGSISCSSPLTAIPTRQKASVRLISAFYIILILLYIKFIYHDSNYDSLIMYFITLAVGRFLYFDSTLEDIRDTLQGVARNLPLLVLMGSYSAIVCWYGFHCGFLLTSNGVILSTLLAHLFMDVSIFVLDKTQLVKLFI